MSGCLHRPVVSAAKCWGLLQTRAMHRPAIPAEMSAWQIHRYGGTEELELSHSLRVPPVSSPQDVLIRVHATSVNPIDTNMLGGYGHTLINVLRAGSGTLEFPLTLGRDLSGEVVAVGGSVDRFRPGDQVWAAVGPQRQGCHAQYVTTTASSVSRRPRSLSHVESAAFPYVATTVWSALVVTGHLWSDSARRSKRVLVLGASGGVGTFAVQLLKAWACEVTATCATDALPLLEDLGADIVVDYTSASADNDLRQLQGYDLILDCSGACSGQYLHLLKPWTYAKYVTLTSPMLRNTDASGLVAGTLQNVAELVRSNLNSHREWRSVRWAFFMPNGCALEQVRDMVDDGKIRPVIQHRLSFEELPTAYRRVMEGHARGKTVVSVIPEEGDPKPHDTSDAQRRGGEAAERSDAN